MSSVLCQLEEIPDGDSRGFSVDGRDIFVVRQGGTVFGYVNVCPHLFTPLEMMPDDFIDDSGQFIICATHGALFKIADGECVAGPCQGESLTKVPLAIEDGAVKLVQ
ncbi:Rieske (2Fe-2S) protein [Oceanibaculum nanhaiense]|uniref:Rieske (2Fe-2S) protein n=1 Tax=Oceanibaculum nanhaiense TaxID=1909734 RepID=UPI00396EC72E